MRLATDLLGDALREPPSSRPRGEPPAEEEPSSPAEPELELLLLLRKEGVKEEEKAGWESEFSLYMETGLVRVGEPPQEPT